MFKPKMAKTATNHLLLIHYIFTHLLALKDNLDAIWWSFIGNISKFTHDLKIVVIYT